VRKASSHRHCQPVRLQLTVPRTHKQPHAQHDSRADGYTIDTSRDCAWPAGLAAVADYISFDIDLGIHCYLILTETHLV
jgi:hypothetical protein